VTVLCGVVVGVEPAVVGVVEGGGDHEVGGPTERGGALTVGPVVVFGADDPVERPVGGGVLEAVGTGVPSGRVDGTGTASSRSTAPSESLATAGGATRFETRPTAANATATLAVTPSTHRQVSNSPRLTQ
jgi:hypothetical protein